jgi:SWI/SNF-related matrix-associated actin-dependent regulator 1 of chromatin subfamily A
VPLDLLPFQEEGARFLVKHERGALFDEMGVGKTAQAIRALDMVDARRIVIVCPAAVREVWKGEFAKFARIPRRIVKGRDIQDLNTWIRGKADVLLLSYEMAVKWTRRMPEDLIDAVVFDEAHYLKNEDSQRTRALLGTKCDGADGLARWSAWTWFLTGTPNPNDAADIWSVLRFCHGTILSKKTFCARYYKAKVGAYSLSHSPRKEMVDELKQVIASVSIRRTKRDAGLQLPPIWLTTTTVDGDTAEIRTLLRDHPGMEKAVVEAVEKGGLSFLDAQHIATLRRLVGEAKAPAFAEMLLEELKNGLDKVVVFGIHTRALDHIERTLRGSGVDCARIDGRTAEGDRKSAVALFQGTDGPRVFLGNIKAAGTGLTLTAAADVVMFEQDWSPAGNAQALMRVHRIGQERSVRARFISLSGSIDEYVAQVVARKTAAIAQVHGPMEYT